MIMPDFEARRRRSAMISDAEAASSPDVGSSSKPPKWQVVGRGSGEGKVGGI